MSAALDWNRVIPAAESTHRAELHLVCPDAIVFFCPIRHVGCVWRPAHQVAQITGPVTVAEFVRAVLARGISLPGGDAMRNWSSAITGGQLVTGDAADFAQLAHAIDEARRGGGQLLGSEITRH